MIGSAGPMGRLLIRGEYGHDIIDELTPQSGDILIDKPGYGAFQHTDLALILHNRGIQRLLLTGVTTDICVHSTLREAVDRSYDCLTIGDACAASHTDIHAAMLACIQGEGGILGSVQTTAEVLHGMQHDEERYT
jgi:nicotinamidase-related amidase